MHKCIKNISKILALSVFFTNFSTIFATKPNESPDVPPKTSSDPVLLSNPEISSELDKLKQYHVFATNELLNDVDSSDTTLKILRQLNTLFDTHKAFTKYFVNCLEYLEHEGSARGFKLDVLHDEPTPGSLPSLATTSVPDMYMRFNYPDYKKYLLLRAYVSLPFALKSRIRYEKYLEHVVSHEFGHLVQDLRRHFIPIVSGKELPEESPVETKKFIQSTLPAIDLGDRWEVRKKDRQGLAKENSLHEKYDTEEACEFFADFFACVRCSIGAPATYKFTLDDIIKKWYPN